MTGDFNTGFSSEDVVIVNGKPANLSFGSVRLEPGLNEIEIRVNQN